MKALKATLFVLSLVPLMILFYWGYKDDLTADPVEFVLHYTGLWSIRFLMITLAMTPLRDLTKNVFFIKVRRMFGLFVFFYVSLHFLVYIGLDLGFRFGQLWEDIIKRPYITVGFLAWLLLLPLAITSNRKMIRKLGKKWKTLHKSIYIIAVLACLHFIWLVKSDLLEPLIYTGIMAVLLFYRLYKYTKS